MADSTHSDDDLLRMMRAGDEQAFVTLYRRRNGAVYRFALQMSGSPAAAEEVTQETFMVLIQEARHYNPARGPLASYLFGVARNLVLRHLGRNRSNLPEALDELNDTLAESAERTDVLAALTQREQIESVRRAVLSLPADYREVVVLCDLQEMSYADAAQTLGCALGTVRSRLHRGRGLLLEKMRILEQANPARCAK